MISANKISDGEKLALYLCVPFDNKKSWQAIQLLFAQRIQPDIKKIYQFAIMNGVAGFVFKNAKQLDLLTGNVINDLQRSYRQTALKNMLALKETLEVLKLLSENNIPVVPLKGAFASDMLFNDLGIYPSGDIDILVHPSDLLRSKGLLCSKGGFSPVIEISENDLLNNHYHLNLKKYMLLEIHWNLVKRYFSIPADFWWETVKSTEWSKISIFELSVENNIIYNIFRIFDHCF